MNRITLDPGGRIVTAYRAVLASTEPATVESVATGPATVGQATAGPGTDTLADIGAYPLGMRDELAATEPLPPHRPVLVYGRQALLPPAFQPAGDARGCARCLARRWQAIRPADLRDALELGGETVAAGDPPYATPFAADALRALRSASATAANDLVYQLDLESLQVRSAPLVPDADCPGCGEMPTPVSVEPALPATPKRARDDFRARDAADLPLRLSEFVNPICGPLGSGIWPDLTSPSTASVNGIFRARAGHSLWKILHGGHANSYGRSTRLSVLEGLERAAGVRSSGGRHTVIATLAELGTDALDPRTCGLYPDAYYDANPQITRFSPDRPITWIQGWSMRDQRPILVPELLVYYLAIAPDQRFVQESSNGCASGGSLVEAVYHGLLETIERDAFMLAWYAKRSLPEIDPHTSSRVSTRLMVDRLAMYGYRARFFDARSTFNIPVVTAVAERLDGGAGALSFGGGASLDPETAMAAGLCEIAADSVMLGRRAASEMPRLRAMVDDYDTVHGLHDHPLLYGLPEMRPHASFLLDTGAPARSVADTYAGAMPLADDLRADLDTCVGMVTTQGFDVIVVDQTLPEQSELGLHTASVTVPGLLPIDFGWTRQRALQLPRLRTALRTAGVLDHDLRDDEIHSVPHPYP